MRADHDIRIGRIRPFGYPAALFVHLYQCRNHIIHPFGRHDLQPRVFSPESIPQRISIIGNALMHLIVKRTIITAIFRKLPRILQGTEKRRIEYRTVFFARPLQVNLGKLFLPFLFHSFRHGYKRRPGRNLFRQVHRSLLEVDKRTADTYINPRRPRRKLDISAYRTTFRLYRLSTDRPVAPCAVTGEVFGELQHIISFESR